MQTIEIAGVEFCFERVPNARNNEKSWKITVKKTGVEMQCWRRSRRSLEQIVDDIKHTAKLCGERFKKDTEDSI